MAEGLVGIRVGAIRTLLNHTGPSLGPWQHGAEYGTGPYNCEARLRDAGVTFAQLEAAGFALQSELYNKYKDDVRDNKGDFRKAYQAAHGGVQVDHRSNTTTTPSGLRPRFIPATSKADQVNIWYQNLKLDLNKLGDDELYVAKGVVVGDGASGTLTNDKTPATTSAAKGPFGRPKVSGPEGWRTFTSAMEFVKNGVASAVNCLRNSEDRAVTAPFADALAAWALTMPDVSKVTSAAFDTSLIRLDSEVEFVAGAPEIALAAFLAKKAGLAETPKTFRATAFSTDGTTFDVQPFEGAPFKRVLTVKTTNAKRVIRAAPAPKVDPKTWKPTAMSIAYLMGEEVLVLSVSADGLTASIDMDGSGEGMDIPVSNLTMTAEPAVETPATTPAA